jgi:UDP-N-acetylglucosamine 1-carboxyvinyltransferase
MASFIIEGGHQLTGTITPQGAKNEALQVICATLLTNDEVVIHNVPNIRDVQNLIQLLRDIGVKVSPIGADPSVGPQESPIVNPQESSFGIPQESLSVSPQPPFQQHFLRAGIHSYSFQASDLNLDYLESTDFVQKCSELRGSVLMIGPLLARTGKAVIAKPGGDKIGRRRMDTHFLGFERLGAQFHHVSGRDVYEISASRLKGRYMLLDEASVTGTANVIMAAVKAKGTTTIYNAACEPYVQQLCRMLNAMGARISGIGSNMLTIEGVETLHGTTHRILPDMIEVGSFIGMAAIVGNGVRIKDVSLPDLGIIPDTFRRMGIKVKEEGDDLFIPAARHYEIQSFIDGTIMTISDAPWPGLTPDLLSVLITVATQARGSVLFHQKMFESRLFFVDKLIDMGAQIILCDPHRAVVVGHDRKLQLRGGRMSSPDIRAGIALLIAAMSARGTSRIDNIEQIDRGYENIEDRLNALGAQISRMS